MTTAQIAAHSFIRNNGVLNARIAVKLGNKWTVRDISSSVMSPFDGKHPLFATKRETEEYFENLVQLRVAMWKREAN